MEEIAKSKESPQDLRKRWNLMINEATWLTIPKERSILMWLDDTTIEIAIQSGNPDQFMQQLREIRPDLKINPRQIDFKALPYEYLLILKLLSGESEKAKDIVDHSRDIIAGDITKKAA